MQAQLSCDQKRNRVSARRCRKATRISANSGASKIVINSRQDANCPWVSTGLFVELRRWQMKLSCDHASFAPQLQDENLLVFSASFIMPAPSTLDFLRPFLNRWSGGSSECRNTLNHTVDLRFITQIQSNMNTKVLSLVILIFVMIGSSYCQDKTDRKKENEQTFEVAKTENEWKVILSPDEFVVLREKGTEYAFTGEYNSFKGKGVFTCAGCDNVLFESKTKYDSGSGWPSFYKPVDASSVVLIEDNSLGMSRTEVVCAKCGGHLGHVFDDGPKPTGQRYCVNSISLDFIEK
jgi:peptide-methionine (R)-S-oxide reductase